MAGVGIGDLTGQAGGFKLADCMGRLGTETAFTVLAKAKALEAQGKSVIHFEIGEPDFDTPKHIVDAGVRALVEEKQTHYVNAMGMPDFRQTICNHMKKTRNLDYDINHVVVTPGAKPIIFFSILALVQAGDEVIYPNPGFPIYESMISFCGGTPVPLKLTADKDFRFDETDLTSLVTNKTKMIIINTPMNPTGGVLTTRELEYVAKVSRERKIIVLSDEIYDAIVYDGFQHTSLASLPGMQDRTIILAGHSKNYAMTGWRLGYGVYPNPELAATIGRLMTNSNSCVAAFTQRAGKAALEGDQTSTVLMCDEFKIRRDIFVDGLNALGFPTNRPQGAFYVFAGVPVDVKMTSRGMAEYLLQECGVACLDGGCFGIYGRGYVRFSYANSQDNIRKGLERIAAGVSKLRSQGVPASYSAM